MMKTRFTQRVSWLVAMLWLGLGLASPCLATPDTHSGFHPAPNVDSIQACWQQQTGAKALLGPEMVERFVLSPQAIPADLAEAASRELLHGLERIVKSWKNPHAAWSDALTNLLTDAAVLQRPYAPQKEFWLTLEKSVHLRLHTALALLGASVDTPLDACPARLSLLMARLYSLDPSTDRGLLQALLIDYARRTNPRLSKAWDALASYSPKAGKAWRTLFDLAADIDEKSLREEKPQALVNRLRGRWNARNAITAGDARSQQQDWNLPLLPLDRPQDGVPRLPDCVSVKQQLLTASCTWPEEVYLWVEPTRMKRLAAKAKRSKPVFSSKEALDVWRETLAFVQTLARAPQPSLVPLPRTIRARMIAHSRHWLDASPQVMILEVNERGSMEKAHWQKPVLVCQQRVDQLPGPADDATPSEPMSETTPTLFRMPRLWPYQAQGQALLPPTEEAFQPVSGVYFDASLPLTTPDPSFPETTRP